MRYIGLNLICFGLMVYTMGLSSEGETDQEQEQEEQQEIDWDKAIMEYESDINTHEYNNW